MGKDFFVCFQPNLHPLVPTVLQLINVMQIVSCVCACEVKLTVAFNEKGCLQSLEATFLDEGN
jgi:hypothetical protein